MTGYGKNLGARPLGLWHRFYFPSFAPETGCSLGQARMEKSVLELIVARADKFINASPLATSTWHSLPVEWMMRFTQREVNVLSMLPAGYIWCGEQKQGCQLKAWMRCVAVYDTVVLYCWWEDTTLKCSRRSTAFQTIYFGKRCFMKQIKQRQWLRLATTATSVYDFDFWTFDRRD